MEKGSFFPYIDDFRKSLMDVAEVLEKHNPAKSEGSQENYVPGVRGTARAVHPRSHPTPRPGVNQTLALDSAYYQRFMSSESMFLVFDVLIG